MFRPNQDDCERPNSTHRGSLSVAGAGFGTGFQGAARTIVRLAVPHKRSGALSIVFIISYLSMGVPSVWGHRLKCAIEEYAINTRILCAVSLALQAGTYNGATPFGQHMRAVGLAEIGAGA